MAVRRATFLAASLVPASSTWVLQQSLVGPDFFSPDVWEFFSDEDPTKGVVDYVDRDTAISKGMVQASVEGVTISPDLDSVQPGGKIPSVRIQSVASYNSGLFVVQVDHQPTGCGIWPAFWMAHEDPEHPWPVWGEADFIEGAHGQTYALTTLHTKANCDQSSLKQGVDFSGHWMPAQPPKPFPYATNCSVVAEDQGRNQGCPQVGPEGSMGKPFNEQGGGTFAFEWDPVAGHFQAFFWTPGNEPADVQAGKPVPESWGIPYAKFLINEQVCPPSRFRDMRIVINTDFCGEWGLPEPAFHAACPDIPASMTCPEYVSTHAKEFAGDAHWSFKKFEIYQRDSTEGAGASEIVV